MPAVDEAERSAFLHTGHQIDKGRWVPRIATTHRQRQRRVHLIAHRLPHAGIGRVQLRLHAGDRDALRRGADLQLHAQLQSGQGIHHDILLNKSPEAIGGGGELIISWRQRRDDE